MFRLRDRGSDQSCCTECGGKTAGGERDGRSAPGNGILDALQYVRELVTGPRRCLWLRHTDWYGNCARAPLVAAVGAWSSSTPPGHGPKMASSCRANLGWRKRAVRHEGGLVQEAHDRFQSRKGQVSGSHIASVSIKRTVVPCSLPLTTTVRAAPSRFAASAPAGAGWSVQPKLGSVVR